MLRDDDIERLVVSTQTFMCPNCRFLHVTFCNSDGAELANMLLTGQEIDRLAAQITSYRGIVTEHAEPLQ